MEVSTQGVMSGKKSGNHPGVLNITYSSSGGTTQTTLDILRACYVSWLHQFHFNPGAANCHNTRNIPSAACAVNPGDEQVMLKTRRCP
jgi:hypothetical protein